jgi:hypothetical protein
MTDADSGLQALWAADQAPLADPAFRLAVVDRLARRRLQADLVRYGVLAAGLAAAVWGVAPLVAEFGDLMLGGAAVAGLAAAGVGLSLIPALNWTMARR